MEKTEYIASMEAFYLREKRDSPDTTGKFHEFLLENGYLNHKKSVLMAGDIGKALSQIGELERKVLHLSANPINIELINFLNYCREIKGNINYPDDLVMGDYHGWWKEKQGN